MYFPSTCCQVLCQFQAMEKRLLSPVKFLSVSFKRIQIFVSAINVVGAFSTPKNQNSGSTSIVPIGNLKEYFQIHENFC